MRAANYFQNTGIEAKDAAQGLIRLKLARDKMPFQPRTGLLGP
jgi:hypothetical protein